MRDDNFFKRPTIPPLDTEDEPPGQPDPIPERIGPYKVDALLDRGGMSLLYLASHSESQAPITIKVLSPKFLSHPEMTARFLKEAEIIALADHPNIIKLYGYGEWEGGLYIAMEFIRGISLRQYILHNPLSLRRALEMILEVAYALCHLHTHGVIHRDLKPENILINELGHIKVIDFGIAQLINPLAVKGNESNGKKRLVGTPVYMSPEQRENPEDVSYPSDIYSLGIIAYELVLGKPTRGYVHLSLMPRGLQKILARALQKKPSDRYLDIVDFIADLSGYIHSSQFEKEKKLGDQGEIFEKFQELQTKLITAESAKTSEFGLIIHRPPGFSALYVDLKEEHSLLLMGESSSLEIEGQMQLLYFKGALDVLLSQNSQLVSLAPSLNNILLQAPVDAPFSFAALQWDLEKGLVYFASCGYGPLWRITSASNVEAINSPNAALCISSNSPLHVQTLAVDKGDTLVLCPLANTGAPFVTEQFKQILLELNNLPAQQMADAVFHKIKSQNIRYFDDHPFVLAVLNYFS